MEKVNNKKKKVQPKPKEYNNYTNTRGKKSQPLNEESKKVLELFIAKECLLIPCFVTNKRDAYEYYRDNYALKSGQLPLNIPSFYSQIAKLHEVTTFRHDGSLAWKGLKIKNMDYNKKYELAEPLLKEPLIQDMSEKNKEDLAKLCNRYTLARTREDSNPLLQVKGEITQKALRHGLMCFNRPATNVYDYEELSKAVVEYFTLCMENKTHPAVSELSMFLRIDRANYFYLLSGNNKLLPPKCLDLLKHTYQFLNASWEKLMIDGEIRDVAGIFLGKNNFGYQDTTQLVVKHENELGNYEGENVKNKYLEELDIEADFVAVDTE